MTNEKTITATIAGRPVRFAYMSVFKAELPFVALRDLLLATRVGIVERVSRMRQLERKCDATLMQRVNIAGREETVIAGSIAGWLIASQISRGRIAPAAQDEFFSHVHALLRMRDQLLLAAVPAAGSA